MVREPIKKTNVVLKNVNFQYAMKLWTFLSANLDDKSKKINKQEDYDANNELKKYMDESFFLNYLIMATTNEINEENDDDTKKEKLKQDTQNEIMNNMLEKMIDVNDELTMEQIKKLIGDKFQVIKYKYKANIKEIEKIFSKHIDKYLEKIN